MSLRSTIVSSVVFACYAKQLDGHLLCRYGPVLAGLCWPLRAPLVRAMGMVVVELRAEQKGCVTVSTAPADTAAAIASNLTRRAKCSSWHSLPPPSFESNAPSMKFTAILCSVSLYRLCCCVGG